jgi:hypothetical protein
VLLVELAQEHRARSGDHSIRVAGIVSGTPEDFAAFLRSEFPSTPLRYAQDERINGGVEGLRTDGSTAKSNDNHISNDF